VQNLRHIKTGQLVTVTVGQETLVVAGLNGAYDPLYSDVPQPDPIDPAGASFFTPAEVAAMLALQGQSIDILLAHGCPAGLGLGREPDHAVPALRHILDALKPSYMFCGHAHFFRHVRHGCTDVYVLAQLLDEYYLLDTVTRRLEHIASRAVAQHHGQR
jgi:hypothetical protein